VSDRDETELATRESERDKVERWRLGELLDAGYPVALAERIAASDADLHRALELVARGCPHRLAAEIVL
jgi:hypothetical protein